MTHMVFFLEEPSAREMLNGLLPRVLPPTVTFQYVVFEGKQDLEKQVGRKLRGWQPPLPLFIVLRDQDGGSCSDIKRNLIAICAKAKRPDTLVRIACHELESWYLGDLCAVELGLGIDRLSSRQRQRKFKCPDNLANAAQELSRLTGGRYQKVSGSRDIGMWLNPERNKSDSFRAFINGVRRLADASAEVEFV
ncbi:MAG: DUF4276 family protein [Alphaproteobacteria bacterium]|nr:DUF4276 family protein [Alphaproteobacteria bacterium]MBF0392746.1 DUF4276 family protein [Alphaproteobacteria bacterium]